MAVQECGSVCSGNFRKFGVLRMMCRIIQQIEITHAVDDNDHILILVDDLYVLLLQQVPASNGTSCRNISRRQTMRSLDDRIQTLLISEQFPVSAECWHDNETDIMGIGSLVHTSNRLGPGAT